MTTRIVWNPTVLTGNFQDAISLILTENAINPTDTDRKITKLEFVASTDPVITALTIDNQAYGETLYDVLHAVCLAKNIGFKITITTTNKFRLELYAGKDRSYDQTTNSYVVFSPSFDNLMNSNYQMSNRFTKTVALVAGEMGVGNIRTSGVAANPAGTTDLDRKEIFVDAQSIGRNSYGETPLTDEEYLAKLVEKGNEVLGENVPIELFDGQAIIDSMYVFGVDYFMGDIIQISNEYGNESKSRIIEMKYFQDPAGVKMTPTYSAIV